MPSLRPALILATATAVAACGNDVSARHSANTEPGASPVAEAPARDLHATPLAAPPPLLELTGHRAGTADGSGYVAVLYSDQDAEVGPRMDGIIRSVHADLGDAVRAGQVLAVLDDGRELARVESAAAVRDMTRAEFNRMDGLVGSGFVTTAQHEEALYRMRMAEAALKEAEVELQHTRVTAPFAGVVTRRMTGAGRPVEVGTPLFRITALRPLRALVRVPERDARAIPVGSMALLVGDGGDVVEARVVRVSPAVDPGSGTVEMVLSVTHPGPLRPGSGASVRFGAMPDAAPVLRPGGGRP
jgi:membrane fusion protein, multidrug efflux system